MSLDSDDNRFYCKGCDKQYDTRTQARKHEVNCKDANGNFKSSMGWLAKKLLKHRFCPKCFHKVGLWKLIFWCPLWAKWDCPNCGKKLKINNKRRIITAILIPTPILILNVFLKDYFSVFSGTLIYIIVGIPILSIPGVKEA